MSSPVGSVKWKQVKSGTKRNIMGRKNRAKEQ